MAIRGSRQVALLTALLVGLGATLFSGIGVGRPAPWTDEAATFMTAGRDMPGIVAVVRHVDAVHALYYVVIHYWQLLAGASVAADRLISVFAVGLTAGCLVLVGREITDLGVGILAGLAYPLIPRVVWMGTEARSYALATAVVTAAILTFLVAARKDRVGWWTACVVLVVLAGYLFLFSALVVAVLPFVVVALPMTGRARGRSAIAAGLAVLLLVPMAVWARSQQEQVDWLEPPDLRLPLVQFFAPSHAVAWWATAVLGWALVLVGLLGAWRAARPRRGGRDRHARAHALLLTGWLAAPTVVLLIGSYVAEPMYNRRYVAPSTPALALLLAIAFRTIAARLAPTGRHRIRRLLPVALLGVWAVACLPSWSYYHTAGSKSAAWADAGAYVAAHKQPGDTVAVDVRYTMGLVHTEPAAFDGVRPLNVVADYRDTDQLADSVVSLAQDPGRLAGVDRVWYIGRTAPQPDLDALAAAGFREVTHRTATDGELYLFTRVP